MDLKKVLDAIWSLLQKLPFPYFAAILFAVAATFLFMLPQVKVFLFGPEWNYLYDKEAETEIFETETKLRNGKITVRMQLELKYGNTVFYILEIQGFYNENQSCISDINFESNGNDGGNEKQESHFNIIVEKQQRDTLDLFKIGFRSLLEEYLNKEYKDSFHGEKIIVEERQIAEIDYQSLNMNRSRPMYIVVSSEETSTVRKSEVFMRNPDTIIDLDDLNLDGSMYENEEIMDIIEKCIEKFDFR